VTGVPALAGNPAPTRESSTVKKKIKPRNHQLDNVDNGRFMIHLSFPDMNSAFSGKPPA
jgi:hypothetical protein